MSVTNNAISIAKLHFGFRRNEFVLKELSLEVPEKAIYGFLGANGAGKSTTIRNILGLLQADSGDIQLFGKALKSHRKEVLSRIGCLIEAPSLYKHLSGYDNLRIACKYLDLPLSRIDEVLELVNLEAHKNKASKNYSTGMKQRLGLAIALLPDPDLLILDEPTNGLDPTGIIEIRNILKALNARGKTIFLSSHLLGEIEKIATQVGILKNGQMVFQGTIGELDRLRYQNLTFLISCGEVNRAAEILRK